ncbi:MAG: hypothetical protein ACJAWL_000541 [Motiliproteus sp.]|jgi:hypothetical protein
MTLLSTSGIGCSALVAVLVAGPVVAAADSIADPILDSVAETLDISGPTATLEHPFFGLTIMREDLLAQSRGRGMLTQGAAPERTDRSLLILADNHQNSPQQPKPVGQAPAKTQQDRPVITELADIGGVLTPKGRLVIEPAFQYTHSSVNRVTFRGIEILSSLAIGALDAQDTDRDALVASLTGRLGLTNRMEAEFKLPYVWRHDTESAVIPQLDDAEISSTLDGYGVGDLEAALHYQLNNGNAGWPFFILNGRLKLANGKGPFDIDRNADGIGQELAIGSGFYSFEPSITGLYPSAPAVFFGNLGYLFNLEDDVNTTIGEEDSDAGAQTIGKVDPGDALRISFGMAYSINEIASFTLGFKNDWIQATKTEFKTETSSTTLKSSTLNIGSMLMGFSFQVDQDKGVNLNLEFGITDDAPDMLITFRMPFRTGSLW